MNRNSFKIIGKAVLVKFTTLRIQSALLACTTKMRNGSFINWKHKTLSLFCTIFHPGCIITNLQSKLWRCYEDSSKLLSSINHCSLMLTFISRLTAFKITMLPAKIVSINNFLPNWLGINYSSYKLGMRCINVEFVIIARRNR